MHPAVIYSNARKVNFIIVEQSGRNQIQAISESVYYSNFTSFCLFNHNQMRV
jgi:hypothetical protein